MRSGESTVIANIACNFDDRKLVYISDNRLVVGNNNKNNMNWSIILTPLLTFVVVQALKLAFDSIKGNFDLKSLLDTYGGMPSSHTAFVVSLSSIVGLKEGFDSALFAVCVIFSLVIISDAFIFRRHVGRYGKALMKIINKIPEPEKKEFPSLDKELGHTFPEVLVGAVVGFIMAFLINLIS